jgi:hypothetical protein
MDRVTGGRPMRRPPPSDVAKRAVIRSLIQHGVCADAEPPLLILHAPLPASPAAPLFPDTP